MVVRMRVNRSKTGKRRSHHALTAQRATRCECGALRLPHTACASCGKYNGKVVIDMLARAARTARRVKRHQKDLRASGQDSGEKKEVASK
ncbi:50S ribosomal protein L32 [Candidatus Kaiserbacteria bacterium RIFCSPHIGHO2_01_FULL_56_24]|uniref:Large ribosomal subunit protein bL32 n=1 Tax=Candidatus Kaiserbacteria bacterium RIFCSPHIGHO2_01_FULL_56_24 TaxID=1798487 RepID=A0A1F6DAR7_9BACT|nr:MAG: 50S ribosomal protein L32 [Candidatus Kaiserbacteria bacterium RIFCSPHIGHO2_01_FULL_56_24]